nr:MAG TPA: anosmin 1-like growth factor receptor [Bacteriophage sp.]
MPRRDQKSFVRSRCSVDCCTLFINSLLKK